MTKIWKMGAIIFATASVVMGIALIASINSYYFKEYDLDDETTFNEFCDDEDGGLVIVYCQPLKQGMYQIAWYLFMSAGLAVVCFAKDSEVVSDPKQNNQQQFAQQPPQY